VFVLENQNFVKTEFDLPQGLADTSKVKIKVPQHKNKKEVLVEEDLEAAPQVARTSAERDIIAGRRSLADELFGETNDPTVREAKMKANLANLKSLASKGLFTADNPAADIATQLLVADMMARSRENVADKNNAHRQGEDVGLSGKVNGPAPETIKMPKPEKDDGYTGFGMDLDQMTKAFKAISGGLGGGGGM
jgi:hypothetical protein